MDVARIKAIFPYLTAEEKRQVDLLLTVGTPKWRPLIGPQTIAYESEADVIGYGGAAGGGKTDLACGLAMTKHTVTAIFRREATQLNGIIERLTDILGGTQGYNGQKNIWRLPDGRRIDFGSAPHAGDEAKQQGRPKDLLVLDEAANFLESQARFLMGWVRTTKVGQKCTTLMTFNPPTSAEGQWIIQFFAPWLVEEHPNPALPGELRWFATLDGKDIEVADSRPFVLDGDERLYEFNPADHAPENVIRPQSRTFIPSRITDNPYLLETGYMTTLQSMPEPLRSQMLKGDFKAGMEDDQWQIIPTAWVKAAQARWIDKDALGVPKGEMDSIGSDPSRGGRDEHVISRRHGTWFAKLATFPGMATPDGPAAATQIVGLRRDRSPVHVDVIGIGSSVYDFLKQNDVQVIPVNNAAGSTGVTREGGLKFQNIRAEIWWRMREALDPMNPEPIALPPDPQLLADLCAPKWFLGKSGIQVEGKDEIKTRIGRSPDRGDAVVLANITTIKNSFWEKEPQASARRKAYDPFAV